MSAPKPPFVGAMDGDLKIANRAAFDRAALLLVVEIPEHINECFACRNGDRQLDAALRADDHPAAAAASRVFCPSGNKLIQEYAMSSAKALGRELPLGVAEQ